MNHTKTYTDLQPAPQLPTTYNTRWRALTHLEVEQLRHTVWGWRCLPNTTQHDMLMLDRNRAIALLLISTGITLDELCALNVSDMKQSASGQWNLVVWRGNRVIPLEYDVLKSVNRWLTLCQLIYADPAPKPLFFSRKRTRITRGAVVDVLDRLKAESKIAFDPFALRHAFIRQMLSRGYLEEEVAAMLGRPSRSVIRMYADVNALIVLRSQLGGEPTNITRSKHAIAID